MSLLQWLSVCNDLYVSTNISDSTLICMSLLRSLSIYHNLYVVLVWKELWDQRYVKNWKCKNFLQFKKLFWSIFLCGCGTRCGSVGRVVTSDSRGPRFESSHWHKFILNSSGIETTEIKEKRWGMALFKRVFSAERMLVVWLDAEIKSNPNFSESCPKCCKSRFYLEFGCFSR